MELLLLKNIDVKILLTVLGIVAVLAVAFAVLIVATSKICAVKTDEKTEKIKEQLSGANCGGCGYAGCADFAKALAEGKADISGCAPTSPENKKIIAEILGVPFSSEEEKIAVVHCQGGDNAKEKFKYVGNEGCGEEIDFMGGKKLCPHGCIGSGSCEKNCIYNAVKVTDGVAKVDTARCTACGVCVKTCPKNIIELIPKSAKVYIACSTTCRGKDVMNACSVGCIGCGLCVKNCPTLAITMENNLPKIDYSKCIACHNCVLKCPRKCIKTL
ncbi:MAG: RnfABCDGE type electron transport complex subunit B [Clostridia bacterium]|nr:RnfABCDGE type electron transport complex subunit B [Clostridia bacterium]